MQVRLHPEAAEEFAEQVDYYERLQPGLGGRFYDEVMETLGWIRHHPRLPRVWRGYRRVNLKVFPFYIAYVVLKERTWVLAVAHARRKPGYWLPRRR